LLLSPCCQYILVWEYVKRHFYLFLCPWRITEFGPNLTVFPGFDSYEVFRADSMATLKSSCRKPDVFGSYLEEFLLVEKHEERE